MNRSERRSWNRYVAEAQSVTSEIDLGTEEAPDILTVRIPTTEQMAKYTQAEDIWDQVEALLGEENADRVRAVAAGAPVTALMNLLEQVTSDLGLGGSGAKNSRTSSR